MATTAPMRPAVAAAAAGPSILTTTLRRRRRRQQRQQLLVLASPVFLLLLLLLLAPIATAAPLGFIRIGSGGVKSPLRPQQRQQQLSRRMVVLLASAGGASEEPPTAVVIVPGYASDASQYRRLEASFHQRGIPAYTVPLAGLMWAPTFGGRSIRPILDRLHATVLDVALKSRPLPPSSLADDAAAPGAAASTSSPTGQYSTGAFLKEMADPSKGARFPSTSNTEEAAEAGARSLAMGSLGGLGPCGRDPPSEQEFGREELRYRVALVAHSAGGWISRLYCSTATYDGRAYNGARFVSTLVTLGSPHVFPPRFRGSAKVPYALRNLQFVTDRCTGPAGGDWEQRVRCVCVGARTVAGGRALGGLVKDWAGYSYEISGYDEQDVAGKGPVWGDGITPLESALGLPGAAARVELEGVYHGPEVEAQGLKWYGSDPEPLERWLGFVLPDPARWPAASVVAGATTAAAAEGR